MGLRSVGSSPAFPTISGYNSDARLINHLNLAISRKKLRMTLQISKRSLKLLNLLHRIGCIQHYLLFKKYFNNYDYNIFVRFTVLFYKNRSFYKGVRLITTVSRKYAISLKALRIMNITTRSSIYILSTSQGVITHKEALRLNVSGLLLCVIG